MASDKINGKGGVTPHIFNVLLTVLRNLLIRLRPFPSFPSLCKRTQVSYLFKTSGSAGYCLQEVE